MVLKRAQKAKAILEEDSVSKPVAAKKPESKLKVKSKVTSKPGYVRVRNKTKNTLNLASCQLEPGKTGEATLAEMSAWHAYIEEV